MPAPAIESLFNLAFQSYEAAKQLLELPKAAFAGFEDLRDAIAYQVERLSPQDYGVTGKGYEEYLMSKGVTPAYRAAQKTVFQRCCLAISKPSDLAILLDNARSEAEVIEAKLSLNEKDYAAGIAKLEAAGYDQNKIDDLRRRVSLAKDAKDAGAACKRPDGNVYVDWSKVDPVVRWLWKDHFPIGISLLAGNSDVGKSTMLNIAANITRGGTYPDGQACEQGEVILITAEDDYGPVLMRFLAQGGDLSRLHAVSRRVEKGKDKFFELEDVKLVANALNDFPKAKLVIIDPIHSFLGRADAHKNADVRRVVMPLVELTRQRGIAVVGVIHFGKDNSKAALARISGSGAWRDLARSVFIAIKDKSDDGSSLLIHEKHNYSARQPTIGYRLNPQTLKIEWDTTVENLTADEALNAETLAAPKLDDATGWLETYLMDGPRDSRKLFEDAGAARYSLPTVRRAADQLGVVKTRRGFGPGASWQWKLPQDRQGDERPGEDTPQDRQGDDRPF